MTKNRKIELLVNDNKRLIDENKRLHKLNNEEISRNMLSEMERYSDVIDKLYEKYRELDKLKLIGIKNRWGYRVMLFGLKVRKSLGI